MRIIFGFDMCGTGGRVLRYGNADLNFAGGGGDTNENI
jgi:hypothetical protein